MKYINNSEPIGNSLVVCTFLIDWSFLLNILGCQQVTNRFNPEILNINLPAKNYNLEKNKCSQCHTCNMSFKIYPDPLLNTIPPHHTHMRAHT